MSENYRIRDGLVVSKWAGDPRLDPVPDHLRFAVTNTYGDVAELTRNDLRLLIQWFLDELLNPHKEGDC
jgi:hypothetical protein